MLFKYIDYSEKFVEITESLLDETAINNTGCDEGFHNFYNYWLEESDTILNQNFWCKLAFDGNELIGVICLGLSPTKEFTIMEIIVAPNKRGKGLGSSIIHELIDNSEKIIGKEYFAEYEKRVNQLAQFLKVFKPALVAIEINNFFTVLTQ